MNDANQYQTDFDSICDLAVRLAFICRDANLQADAITQLGLLLENTMNLKQQAIELLDEDLANELLAREYMIDSLKNELDMYLNIKSNNPDAAWTCLINAQMSAKHAVQSHSIAAHLVERYIPRLHAFEFLLFPPLTYFSAGMIVLEDECSICGHPFDDCDHIKGRPYMGKLCSRIITKSKLLEVSLVDEPASKRHREVSFRDKSGVLRNSLSLAVMSEENKGSDDAPSQTY